MKCVKITMAFVAVLLFATPLYAETTVTVTGVTAQQRYPWNGKVDIVVTIRGDTNEIAQTECALIASNCETRTAISVSSVIQQGNDVFSNNACTRRYLWNAATDVGAVMIDDLALTVGLHIQRECHRY